VPEKPQRRQYSQAYKERIVREAEACTEQGQIGGLLRREGLYWSILSRWRQEYTAGGRHALAANKRGRKPTRHPLQSEVEALRKENQRLEQKLVQAETIIEVQKKLSQLLGLMPANPKSDEPC
jgi:transposase